MKRFFSLGRLVWLLPAVFVVGLTTTHAQTITKVEFDLPSLDYDVIYLGDFVDISSNKLAKNIPNFSGSIRADGKGYIHLEAYAYIKLKGDATQSQLVYAYTTKPFKIDLLRSLTANDLAGGVSDIDISSVEDKSVRKRLEDYAEKFPTAPVGDYILILSAFDSAKARKLGETRKVISVRNASPEEVQVNLIDPQPGATIASTLPTFSWNSPNPKVTLFVYEKLAVHQSPQEAITGIPYLKQDVEGRQTLTYPTDAQRRLEQNKTYVWFVETGVTTNRQTIQKRSEVRLFRIQTENQQNQVVQDLMNNLGGAVSGTFSTLQSLGWQPTGRMTLDGKPLTLDDLKALIAKLAAQNAQVTVRIE